MAKVTPKFRIENNVLIGQEVPIPEKCPNIGELILEKLKSKPDFVAQIEAATGKRSTFAELREQSVRCAIWMKRQGIQPGDVIGVCTDNNLYTRVPIFAIAFVAGIITPTDHDLTVTSARYFLSIVSPKLVFANAEVAENVVQAAKEENLNVRVITIGERRGFESLADIIESVDRSEIDDFRCTPIKSPSDVATIAWSSGTTGLPKGTELSHRSVVHCTSPIEDILIEGEISMWTPTIRWNFGLTLMIEGVLSSSLAIIIPDVDDDLAFIGYIQKYGVTYFTCDPSVPTRWVKLGLMEKHRIPSLSKFVLSGAHLKAHQQEVIAKLLPHTEILNCYGMTDTGGACATQSKGYKPGSCGYICKGVQMKIVDMKTGVAQGANATGEIWVKSPSQMNGYYKNPEETKKIMDSDGWIHTGDVGYYDEDGEIFLVDRISEFINYRSINLSPAEIESVLESHPSVLKAAVVPVPHELEEEHPMAFIMKVPGKEVTEEELKKLVKESLPWYCELKGGVKFMDELPRTATGKIAKKRLKELAKSFAINTTTA